MHRKRKNRENIIEFLGPTSNPNDLSLTWREGMSGPRCFSLKFMADELQVLFWPATNVFKTFFITTASL